jgi:hypothetical protein
MATDELPYKIETWDASETRVEELIARVSHIFVAQAAFDRATEVYPERVITLKIGARVMRHHRGSVPVLKVPGA